MVVHSDSEVKNACLNFKDFESDNIEINWLNYVEVYFIYFLLSPYNNPYVI